MSFTLYILLIISLSINEIAMLELDHEDVRFSKSTQSATSYRMEQVYQMLMEHERQRIKLLKNSKADDMFKTDLYVTETNGTQNAKTLAEKFGFTLVRKVFKDENFYLLRKHECKKKRCKRSNENTFQNIGENTELQWTERQRVYHRDQRILPNVPFNENDRSSIFSEFEDLFLQKNIEESSERNLLFNDPLFKEQWYLHNSGQTDSPAENDINVLPVWQSGITGRDVSICVLDDGVYGLSEEVADNYDPALSEEFLFRSTGFLPIPENSHGTRCAAIAAGVANNNVCGVGVAYEAKVGGVRILNGPLTDVQEAMALVHALDHTDIYTASWGPDDKGGEVDGPKILTKMAFIKGVTMGRQGKGSIYVWAAGNGGGYHDNCSLDGYASSPFTLTIGALTEDGLSTFYTEPCPSVITSTYVGGHSHSLPSTISWLEDKKKIKVVVPEGRGKCKETFQGTSAAAPMAAGVIALALQANPSLTWRDVQHLIIRTSRIPYTVEQGWFINGAGFTFHPKIGSGVLDAHALVTLARKWKPVKNLRVWTMPAKRKKWVLLPRKFTSIPLLILTPSMPASQRISRLETVIITVNVRHTCRGDLEMTLKSPSTTTSPILTRRLNDNKTDGFDHWDFVSLHFWGEDPEGLWVLKIMNHNQKIDGLINYISLTLHGTS